MSEHLPEFISISVQRGRYAFLNLDPGQAEDCPVACAGWEECTADYEIQRQGFRFPAIEYIAGGEWDFTSAKGKWRLGPGSIFTYGPGISYSLKAASKSGLSKYFLDFSYLQSAEVLRQAGLNAGEPSSLTQRRWLQDLLDQLIDTEQMRPPAKLRVAAMIAALMLERIVEDLHPMQRVTQAHLTYERCRDYLTKNYLDIFNLADAAKKCGVSQVHLCRLFLRFATESPNAFITRLKINHAAERIARCNLPVKAAAAEVGFDDPYHFSRVFKKVHGISPSQFGASPGRLNYAQAR